MADPRDEAVAIRETCVYDWSARLSRMWSALGNHGLGDSRFTAEGNTLFIHRTKIWITIG